LKKKRKEKKKEKKRTGKEKRSQGRAFSWIRFVIASETYLHNRQILHVIGRARRDSSRQKGEGGPELCTSSEGEPPGQGIKGPGLPAFSLLYPPGTHQLPSTPLLSSKTPTRQKMSSYHRSSFVIPPQRRLRFAVGDVAILDGPRTCP